MAQISHRTGFLLQGDSEREQAVNTGAGWKSFRDPAYSPLDWRDIDKRLEYQYYVAGSLERVDGARYPWGWEQPEFDDSGWQPAQAIDAGAPIGVESHQKWQLTPSPVPLLAETPQRFARVARSQGATPSDAFLQGSGALTLAPHSQATILLDQGVLTTGYPVLVASGGRGSLVRATYSEALYGEKRSKGDRRQIEGNRRSECGTNGSPMAAGSVFFARSGCAAGGTWNCISRPAMSPFRLTMSAATYAPIRPSARRGSCPTARY
jgi:alpha-L-rhamnosidase